MASLSIKSTHSHLPQPSHHIPQRFSFMKVAFKGSSFKNSSYHMPTASYIHAKELRKELKENIQVLRVRHLDERIRCPALSFPTRVKQVHTWLLTPHLHQPSSSSSLEADPAAAAAKSLQVCPTLCDPIDGSPPGSLFPGILQQEHWSGLPFPFPTHESEN